jgi:tetratricopeptide (TPR) repeat protein
MAKMIRTVSVVILAACSLGLGHFLFADAAPEQSQATPVSHYERPVAKTGPFKDRVIVFVHGIFGNAGRTWTAPTGAYWPRLLLGDDAFHDFDVYVANYESPPLGNTLTVDEVVATLNSRFTADGVFTKHREVVFVCHSLGGIIVQQLLLTFRENARKVPLIYFFGVPEEGAQVAAIGKWFSSDPLLKTLLHGNENEYLLSLENQWRAARFEVHRYCAYEKKPVKGGIVIVDRLSSTRNCDDPPIPINEDHFGIVKPSNRAHDSYIALRNAILAYKSSPQSRAGAANSPVKVTKHVTALKGLVVANQLGGQPLSGVIVSAVGAKPTESAPNDGSFTLEFAERQPGESVQITASKYGYIVINSFQLRTVLPKYPAAEPLMLLMCKEGEREEWSRLYYGLKSDDVIRDTYQKTLATLIEAHDDTGAARAKLADERDQAKSVAVKNPLDWTRIEDASALYADALSLFSGGNVTDALKVLDEDKLRESAKTGRSIREEGQKELAESVQAYLLRARILTTQLRFDEVQKTYLALLEVAPDNFDAHFAFAYFSQQLHRDNQALAAYKESLKLARLARSSADVAKTLSNMAVLQGQQNLINEARQGFDESVTIYRQLAQDGSDIIYLRDEATTLNNIGVLSAKQNQTAEARQAFEEALRIRRRLSQLYPEIYLPDVAMTLSNLGILNRNGNHKEQARQDYEEALRILKPLVNQDSESYLPEVATILNNLGVLYDEQAEMDEARQSFEEALRIRRQLARENPERYLPDVATALHNLGNLNQKQSRTEDARQDYAEVLKILNPLAEHNPAAYLAIVAATFNSLAILDRNQNRIEDARQEFNQALEIYVKLAEENSERYSPDVSRVRTLLEQLEQKK